MCVRINSAFQLGIYNTPHRRGCERRLRPPRPAAPCWSLQGTPWPGPRCRGPRFLQRSDTHRCAERRLPCEPPRRAGGCPSRCPTQGCPRGRSKPCPAHAARCPPAGSKRWGKGPCFLLQRALGTCASRSPGAGAATADTGEPAPPEPPPFAPRLGDIWYKKADKAPGLADGKEAAAELLSAESHRRDGSAARPRSRERTAAPLRVTPRCGWDSSAAGL